MPRYMDMMKRIVSPEKEPIRSQADGMNYEFTPGQGGLLKGTPIKKTSVDSDGDSDEMPKAKVVGPTAIVRKDYPSPSVGAVRD